MGRLKTKLGDTSHWGSGGAFLTTSGKRGLKYILEQIIDFVDDLGAEDVKDWILSTDAIIQFFGGNVTRNEWSGAPGTPVTCQLQVTNGVGKKDVVNSISTVQVSISGGTAAGKTINGGAGPVTVTLSNGIASVTINATGAGTAELALSNPTHPSETLDVTDTGMITFA